MHINDMHTLGYNIDKTRARAIRDAAVECAKLHGYNVAAQEKHWLMNYAWNEWDNFQHAESKPVCRGASKTCILVGFKLRKWGFVIELREAHGREKLIEKFEYEWV